MSLNMRQLLNPIFYSPVSRHPDSTRQRKARQRAKVERQARALKAQYVPLCRVDPAVYLLEYDGFGLVSKQCTITGRIKKDVQAVWMPAPSGAWRRYELSA